MQLFLALILASSPQPSIVGPTHVRPGDLAVLTATPGIGVACLDGSAKDSTPTFAGLAFRWMLINSDKQFWDRSTAEAPTIGFFTNDPGTYTFVFLCSDGKSISVAKHVLTVGGSPPSPFPGPPDPAPGPSRFGITEAARQWIAEVPATERSKSAGFAAKCDAIADTVLKAKQVRLPQELMNEMYAEANALGPGWSTFRDRMKAFILEIRTKMPSSQDAAEFIRGLAAGVRSG